MGRVGRRLATLDVSTIKISRVVGFDRIHFVVILHTITSNSYVILTSAVSGIYQIFNALSMLFNAVSILNFR